LKLNDLELKVTRLQFRVWGLGYIGSGCHLVHDVGAVVGRILDSGFRVYGLC
jgi:hypothetical protein